MTTEATGAGFYRSEGWNQNYPKIQILTMDIKISPTDRETVQHLGLFLSGAGYVVARIDGRVQYLSRYLLGALAGDVVIHRNGDRLDFRRGNLAIADRGLAMQRQGKRAGSTSRYKGVQLHRKSGRWRAMLWRGDLGRSLHLGYFDTEQAAALAYDLAAADFYGPDARLNFA